MRPKVNPAHRQPASAPRRLLLAALLASVAAVSSVARADPQLPVYQTRHYTLHSDLNPDMVRDLSQRLDAMYEEYSRRLETFGPPRDRNRNDVWIFNKKSDYMDFIDDRLPNTGGVFIPSRNCLAAFLEGQGRDALRRTLQHEAFHQFAHATISHDLPVWVNEGIAQLFEEGLFTGKQFIVGQVPPRRLRQLKDDMERRKLTPFEPFVFTSHEDWARNMRDREKGTTQYNQAWAMTHFLVYAADAKGEPLYRKRFFNMLKQMRDGVDSRVAFSNNFGNNFNGFQDKFVEYTRSLTATPEATYMEHVEVLSDLMVELRRRESRTFKNILDFRGQLERGGYQLKYSKGSLKWSTDPNVSIYFRDVNGRDLANNQIGFLPNRGAPLPDLVIHPPGGQEYRARFYFAPDGSVDREIIVRGF